MTVSLPEIEEDDYAAWQRELFERQTSNRIGRIGFDQRTDQQIADIPDHLNALEGQWHDDDRSQFADFANSRIDQLDSLGQLPPAGPAPNLPRPTPTPAPTPTASGLLGRIGQGISGLFTPRAPRPLQQTRPSQESMPWAESPVSSAGLEQAIDQAGGIPGVVQPTPGEQTFLEPAVEGAQALGGALDRGLTEAQRSTQQSIERGIGQGGIANAIQEAPGTLLRAGAQLGMPQMQTRARATGIPEIVEDTNRLAQEQAWTPEDTARAMTVAQGVGDVANLIPTPANQLQNIEYETARAVLEDSGLVTKDSPTSTVLAMISQFGIENLLHLASGGVRGLAKEGSGLSGVVAGTPFGGVDERGFFSPVERATQNLPRQGELTAQQVSDLFKKRGVPEEELRSTGMRQQLDRWTQEGTPITRQMVEDALTEGRVQTREVWKGAGLPGGDTSWGLNDYTLEALELPGGENYRELLLQFPNQPSQIDRALDALRRRQTQLLARIDELHAQRPDEFLLLSDPEYVRLHEELRSVGEGIQQAERNLRSGQQVSGTYQAPHWAEPNVSAHVRFNDRTLPDGRKALHIEEIQSDMSTAANRRKKWEEYDTKIEQANDRRFDRENELLERGRDLQNTHDRLLDQHWDQIYARRGEILQRAQQRGEWVGESDAIRDASREIETLRKVIDELDDIEAERMRIGEEVDTLHSEQRKWRDPYTNREPKPVPDAPYVQQGGTQGAQPKSYPEHIMRRLTKWASDNGYDAITWTTGTQQVERYTHDATQGLEIGTPEFKAAATRAGLQGGGEMHRLRYDVELPQIARKRFGANVEGFDIPGAGGAPTRAGVDNALGVLDDWASTASEGGSDWQREFADALTTALADTKFSDLDQPTLARVLERVGNEVKAANPQMTANDHMIMAVSGANFSDAIFPGGNRPSTYGVHGFELTPEIKARVQQGQPEFGVTAPQGPGSDATLDTLRTAGRMGGMGLIASGQDDENDPNAALKRLAGSLLLGVTGDEGPGGGLLGARKGRGQGRGGRGGNGRSQRITGIARGLLEQAEEAGRAVKPGGSAVVNAPRVGEVGEALGLPEAMQDFARVAREELNAARGTLGDADRKRLASTIDIAEKIASGEFKAPANSVEATAMRQLESNLMFGLAMNQRRYRRMMREGTMTAKDHASWEDQLRVTLRTQEALQAAASEWGRTGKALGEEVAPILSGGAGPTAAQAQQIGDFSMNAAALKAVLDKLSGQDMSRALADDLLNVDVNDIRDVTRYLATKARQANWAESIVGLTSNNLLTSPRTLLSNAVTGLGETVNRPLMKAIGGDVRGAADDVGVMLASIGDALADARTTYESGMSVGRVREALRRGKKMENVEEFLVPHFLPGRKGTWMYGTRGSQATDEFFRSLNTRAGLASEARAEAARTGQPIGEVLANPTKEMLDRVYSGVNEATYGGEASWLGRMLSGMRTKIRSDNNRDRVIGLMGYAISPFVRVSDIIMGRGTEISTAGMLGKDVPNMVGAALRREGVNLNAPRWRDKLGKAAPDWSAMTEAQKGMTVKAAVNAGLLGLIMNGVVTGTGPRDPAKRAALMEARDENGQPIWRPNSVKIAGQWVPQSLFGPLSIPMTIMANFHDTYAYDKRDPTRDDLQRFQDALEGSVAGVAQNSYLDGFAQLAGAINDRRIVEEAGEVAGGFATRFAPSVLTRDARDLLDPYKREKTGKNIVQRVGRSIQERIPGASRLLEPTIERTTGEPALRSGGDLFRGGTTNPGAVEVDRLNRAGQSVSLPDPQGEREHFGAEQSPQQQTEIARVTGNNVRRALEREITRPTYAQAPDEVKSAMLTAAIGVARTTTDIALGDRVARSVENQAERAFDALPHYVGVSGSADNIRRQNAEIARARSIHAALTAKFGGDKDKAMAEMRKVDPELANQALNKQPLPAALLRDYRNRAFRPFGITPDERKIEEILAGAPLR